jgi:hypothetical protein
MLTLGMIAVWVVIGGIGMLLLWHAIKDDELLADQEEDEHDVSDCGECGGEASHSDVA